MPDYFAYGSNCNPAVMERKGVEFTSRQRALLRGYRLRFNKRALREALPEGIGFANVNVDPTGEVEGILYHLTDESLEKLDLTERYPDHYGRQRVVVETDSGEVECWCYHAQPDKLADGLVPSRNYLNHILAARDFLSQQYFAALDQSQTYTGNCACCHKHSEVMFLRQGDDMFILCQPCREASIMWGGVRGRPLTVAETEAVMQELVLAGHGFNSLQELVATAVEQKLIDP